MRARNSPKVCLVSRARRPDCVSSGICSSVNLKQVKERVLAAYTVNSWRTATFACATPLRCNSPKVCVSRVHLIAYRLECALL